jgi:peroxiredoxin/tetratricopeptide (TPR) repeat protein
MRSISNQRRLATAAVFFLCALTSLTAADPRPAGHSHINEVFDTGPRTKPVEMKSIGHSHFPITHKNPEVQKWFDQGHTLLHSFWYYEAERSFRWCLKLEPENAMCYFGLARAAGDERSEQFIKEAVKRKHTVSERERLYIEALETRGRTERLRDRSDDYRETDRLYKKKLESICVKYPDDVEAKLLLALANMGDSRYGTELILRAVEAKQPDHPGAHHYRIHNWNYHEPEMALKSSAAYGRIAPNIGHALHMPGHIYATVGMWKEAARAMDAATRTEVRHMHERQVFPFNYWNWGHNRAYLSYIQEQLGEPDLAIAGARDLLEAPRDPDSNADHQYSPFSQGLRSLARALVKYERWKDILDTRTFPWRDIKADKLLKAYVHARAHLGLQDLDAAEKDLKEIDSFEKEKDLERHQKIMAKEIRARIALSSGDQLYGLGLLTEAAEAQFEMQKGDNDPPFYPQVLYNALGDAYSKAGSKDLAAKAYEKTLDLTRNDRWALKALNREAKTAEPERPYSTNELDSYGPKRWSPLPAPNLSAQDPDGKTVSLTDFKGKDVIVVFYLGRTCPHCLKQLRDLAISKTPVLALSTDSPETNKKLAQDEGFKNITLLSDPNRENAKRFLAHDDFEEIPLHATLWIDQEGHLRWSRIGGAPFDKLDWLAKTIDASAQNSH